MCSGHTLKFISAAMLQTTFLGEKITKPFKLWKAFDLQNQVKKNQQKKISV